MFFMDPLLMLSFGYESSEEYDKILIQQEKLLFPRGFFLKDVNLKDTPLAFLILLTCNH